MTIRQEDEAIPWRVICDECGEVEYLEAEFDAEMAGLVVEVQMLGWRHDAPSKVKFIHGTFGDRPLTQTYENDLCPVCKTDEPRPKPIIRDKPVYRPIVSHDAFANDPCDEWPRKKVWEAAGLRTDCGHPKGPARCPICDWPSLYGSTLR